jgi:hypothetical protein
MFYFHAILIYILNNKIFHIKGILNGIHFYHRNTYNYNQVLGKMIFHQDYFVLNNLMTYFLILLLNFLYYKIISNLLLFYNLFHAFFLCK